MIAERNGHQHEVSPVRLDLPDPPDTDDNSALALHWHEVAHACGRGTLEAAARCGEVLAEQRDLCAQKGVGFKAWCAEHLPFKYRQASSYIKVAQNWSRIETLRRTLPDETKPVSIREALKHLRGEPTTDRVQRAAHSSTDTPAEAVPRDSYEPNTKRKTQIANKAYERLGTLLGMAAGIADGIDIINVPAAMSVLRGDDRDAWVEDIDRVVAALRSLGKRLKTEECDRVSFQTETAPAGTEAVS